MLEKMIREALSQNEDITSVYDFRITKDGSYVTVLFHVDTIYGDTEISQEVEI
jgi:hypothetical protein